MTRTFEGVDAHPLSWPVGWKRATVQRRSQFGQHSVSKAAKRVLAELQRTGVGDWNVIISSNVALRLDGLPRANQRIPEDAGVAVYFRLKGEPHVLACDKWDLPEHNLWAIARHIEALRAQERWGVGSLEQAFTGYKALPQEASQTPWWQVFGFQDEPNHFESVKRAYKSLALKLHPDVTGDDEGFKKLGLAYMAAKEHFAVGARA